MGLAVGVSLEFSGGEIVEDDDLLWHVEFDDKSVRLAEPNQG